MTERGRANPNNSLVPQRVAFNREDAISLGLLLLGFVVVLSLVPPTRAFPMTDDWIYAPAVGDLLRWDYHPPLQSQANLVSHIAWGAVFALLLGESYTTFTIAMLIASMLCLGSFYFLLRHVGVSPKLALLGTATLALNPLYLYLSYAFMTDVTFLACWLSAGLFLLRGFQGYGERWLWLGGLMAALAYLTRQPGILLVVAALAYMVWVKQWSWRRAVAVAGIPVTAAIVYTLWERTQPASVLSGLVSQMIADITRNPVQFFASRLPFVGLLLNGLGLFLLPVLRLPRRLLLAIPLFALFAVLVFLNTRSNGSAFPTNGNILDRTGFVMWNYSAAPLWTEWLWALIGICSAFMLAVYVAALLENVPRSRIFMRGGPGTDPVLVLYIQAALMGVFVLFVTPVLYDRYILPILPLLMVPALRRASTPALPNAEVQSRRSGLLRWAALALLATFSVVCMRDYMDHATVRWRAAEQLAQRGIPRDTIDAGFEWQGLYWKMSGAPGEVFPSSPGVNYRVSDIPVKGYHMIGSLPYSSWLSGGETRYVLQLERDRGAASP